MLVLLLSPLAAQTSKHVLKADRPAQDEIRMQAVKQDSNGVMRYLRGAAVLETTEMKISADEIDFDSDTDWAYARGHVRMEHFATGDIVNAERAEYNLRTEEGKFWNLTGTAPAKLMTNPGTLSTTNPFYFQALWADRIKDRYILHKGFITDCKMPKPWWIFQAPKFDIIPGDRAIARHSILRVHKLPVFYLPYYYRPLGRNPRASGFLTPDFGHSSFYGYIYGAGYYWAMSPSYDMTGVLDYYTQRGPAFTYNVRGKPNQVTDFNINVYDVQDRGVASYDPLTNSDATDKQGGLEIQATARTSFAGFTGQLSYNYLSSLLFREAFSYSFITAIYNEVDSVGFLQRRFQHQTYTLSFVGQQNQVFEAITHPSFNEQPNQVILRKLPSVELEGNGQNIGPGSLPVWFSLSSSASLIQRSEPTGLENPNGPPAAVFNTGVYGRMDAEPHVQTSFKWDGFSLTPGLTLGLTNYTNSYATNSTTYTPTTSCNGYPTCSPTSTVSESVSGDNLLRKDADFTLDLRMPSLERVYTPPKWLRLGTKIKHVIEGEAKYEYVTGVEDFNRIIHYDETDILSDTNQLTFYLNNRFYRKDSKGNVSEFLTWKLAYARYFDPTFGGAVVSGVRNVVLSAEDLTPFTFLYGPRDYSPVTSSLILTPSPFLSFEWHTDYDPAQRKFIDQSFNATVRKGKYFGSLGENSITTDPLLIPEANQISFGAGYGSVNRRGWNINGTLTEDVLLSRILFEYVTTTYNTDCCGFSFQLRHLNFGIRNDNQYLFSFSLANLGTFGSLQRQDKVF
jgi:LPS-assembly protein